MMHPESCTVSSLLMRLLIKFLPEIRDYFIPISEEKPYAIASEGYINMTSI